MPGAVVDRPCYTCGTRRNPLIAEEPVEYRFGRPLIPEGVYRFVRCRSCGTLYVDSEVTDGYLVDLYRGESIEVDQAGATTEEAYRRVLQLRMPEFERHWKLLRTVRPPREGDRLLDFGCQMGDFGTLALSSGVVPNGIELSEPYAEACRRRWGDASVVHCGALEMAPYADGSFQYITAFETLEHMCDPVSALSTLKRWMARDGVLGLSVPSSDYFHFKYWLLRMSPVAGVVRKLFQLRSPFYRRQVLPHTHIYNFSRHSVRLLVEKAGLRPRLIRPTGWHGRIAPALGLAGRGLEYLSGGRWALAPGFFVVADLADGGNEVGQ